MFANLRGENENEASFKHKLYSRISVNSFEKIDGGFYAVHWVN